ncbi:hypothetical protein [Agaribacter marinus]|uniref:DUF2059 domain-containing protein n=1 Tax=Agaribacter marinus TaxID=1431249 RepID=A0AA37SVS7_9ALTE|nr:hypothetical protein [Agaribacter marinus]GLR69599.1 hypothetical protein GCM10007852_05070 [Agaribacter marinus]
MKIVSFATKALAILLFIMSFNVSALDQGDIDKYVKSIELLKSTDNPVIKSIEDSLSNNPNFHFDVSDDGSIKMMSQVLGNLEPKQETVLSEFLQKAGYSSVAKWTDVGDRVSAAMMAVEAENTDDQFSEITPEMVQAMPKAMQEQMQGAMRMFKALKSVPQADIDLVKANHALLDRVME